MAFGKGVESTEGPSIERYIGVAPVSIVKINPTKAELEEIYGTKLENESEYVGTQEANGEKVAYARVTFLVKPNPEKIGKDISPISMSFFLKKEYRFNRDGSKVQVIDEYGNSGWATKDECNNHTQLMSKEGKPLKIGTNYRPAYNGEIALTDFIKAYLNIPDAHEYVNGAWHLKKDADLSIARFDNIDKLFSGDFTEIKDVIAFQPDNFVKVLFGVRKKDDGKMFQSFFDRMFLKNRETNYNKLDAEVRSAKNNGAFSTTDFEVCDFKVYSVAATNFQTAPDSDLPFGMPAENATTNNPWFKV